MTTFDYCIELHYWTETWLADNLPAPTLPTPESFKTEIPYNDYDDYYESLDKYNFINYNNIHMTYNPESFTTYYNFEYESDTDSEIENENY